MWEEKNFGSPIKVDERFEEIVENKAEEIQGKQLEVIEEYKKVWNEL